MFSRDTLAWIKDPNVLVVGYGGTGIEATKNLLFCIVGAVALWDPQAYTMADRGANFYVMEGSVEGGERRGRPRAWVRCCR